MYQIQQKILPLKTNITVCLLRYRQNIAKTDRTLHLRWQCSISNGRECCGIPINLSRLLSVSVMYQIKLTSLKNARETTLSRQKVPNSPKEEKAADFLHFIQQDVKPYIEQHFDINKENNISLAILWWVIWTVHTLPSTGFISILHLGKSFSLGERLISTSK